MFGRKKEKAVSTTPQDESAKACSGKASSDCSGKASSSARACSGRSSTKTISDNCKCAK